MCQVGQTVCTLKFDTLYARMSYVGDDFGAWLHAQLEKRHWSGRELARQAGVSPNTIALTIKGETNPSPELCRAIAIALKVPIEEVFRHAGHLPASDPVAGEDELLFFFRGLPEQDRRRFLRAIRSWWEDAQDAES